MLPVNLIMNVYNGESFIHEALQSLVDQDYLHIKIHCFDNHSTDKTVKIINEFKSKYRNVYSYITPNHIPLVDARLYAVSEISASTEEQFYFGFCDADDIWDANWASNLMEFGSHNYDLLVCNGYILDGDNNTPFSSCLSMARPSPFSCPVAIQSCLFNSSIIKKDTPLFDNKFPIIWDTEFWLRRGPELNYLHISDYLFHYRIHSSSMVQSNFFPILRERWNIFKLHNLSLSRFLFDFLRQLKSIIFSSK